MSRERSLDVTHRPRSLKLRASVLGLAALVAAAYAGGVPDPPLETVVAQLQQQVAALPSGTAPERIKKAVLNVALEQAAGCLAVDYLIDAGNRVADVQEALAADPEVMAAADPAATDISVTRPIFTPGSNPYLDAMHSGLAGTLASADAPWGKNTTSHAVLSASGTTYYTRNVGAEMEAYLFMFANPASSYHRDAEVLTRFLRRAHAYADTVDVHDGAYSAGQFVYDDFAIAPFSCAAREFARLYPGLVLPSQQAMWDRAMTKAGVKMWTKAVTDDNRGIYANIDLVQAYELLNFGLYLGHQDYLDKARWLVDVQTDNLHPDGAWSYIWTQNESPGYHSTDVDYLARYYRVSGYPMCTNLIRASQWYGPVSNGRAYEFWTAPSWKQLWNRGVPDTGGEAAMAFSGNRYLRWMQDAYVLPAEIANTSKWRNLRWSATFYRNDIVPKDLPEAYTVLDQNILGPRAWNGRFTYAANGRNFADGKPGHYTLMGAAITQAGGPLLDAIVMGVYPRVRANLGSMTPTTDPSNNGWMRDWAWLTSQLNSDYSMGRDFSALSATYRLHRYASSTKGAEVNWHAKQQWLGLPDRIIGWLSVAPDPGSAQAYEVDGIVRLGTGGTVNSPAKTLRDLGGGTYGYGDLRITLHDHTFGAVTTPLVPFRLAPYPTTEITLRDPRSIPHDGTNLLTYASGTEYHYVVEIRPAATAEAATVNRHTEANGLRTLAASVPGATYLLVYNPTPGALTFSDSVACPHAYAAWFTGWGTQSPRAVPLTVTAGQAVVSRTLPPRGHALFVNAEVAERLQLGFPSGTAYFAPRDAPPAIGGVDRVGTNLVLKGTNGTPGASCHVLGSADLEMPPSGWTVEGTAQFDAWGRFAFAGEMRHPVRFHGLRLEQ